MRARTHTILKAFLALVLCLGMLITVMPATPASAAKMTNKKAQKILKKKIKNKFCKYTFVDLDKDKIDEMIVFTYSGKFVDNCDDSKKTVTVYKVSGKKAKAVLTDSLEGDFYQPEFHLNLYYYNKKSYITVHEIHEGYSFHNTYVFEGGKYKSYACTEEEISEEDTVYSIGAETVTRAEYEKAMAKIFAGELSCEMQLSSTKTVNAYLKKLFKARYDRSVEQDAIAEGTKYSFSDFDGDGLLEMFVETGKKSGYILYATGKNELSSAFGANSLSYTLDADGDYVWGWDAFQYDNENGTALQYTGRWFAENNFYIDVTREGEKYVFHVKYYPNAFDSEEWIYFTDYLGESEDLMASFSCLDGGTYTSVFTDRTTGEEISNSEYVGGAEFYHTYGEGFTWLDLDDPAGGIGNGLVFKQVGNDD